LHTSEALQKFHVLDARDWIYVAQELSLIGATFAITIHARQCLRMLFMLCLCSLAWPSELVRSMYMYTCMHLFQQHLNIHVTTCNSNPKP
jgi:hypothetical protein